MDEKSLEEQLKKLNQEQSETENAYAENFGKINKSILVAWAQEILEREEKIQELKQKIKEESVQPKSAEKRIEETEEKSLVVVKKSPLQWIMQKINQIRKSLKQNDYGLNNVPGLSTEQLQDLRQKRLNKYHKMIEEYEAENKSSSKTWELNPEAERIFREGEKDLLSNQNEKNKTDARNTNPQERDQR